MKILIAGGTGFIGSYLTSRLQDSGHEVKIISRSAGNIPWQTNEIAKALEHTDVLLNMAGRSINCRHTPENKAQILKSRLETTLRLGEAMQAAKKKPEIWINASASAIYDAANNQQATETTYQESSGFLGEVVRKWEHAFFSSTPIGTRQIALRTSVVLGKNGGAFRPLQLLTKFGLGGKAGAGTQSFSWIHIEDYFRIITYCIEHKDIAGIVNCTSPEPLSNQAFMHTMQQCCGMLIGIPAPAFAIKIAARFINTDAGLILNPVNFIPEKLVNNGFQFQYPTAKLAINDLIG
ncbi:MAG: TIGR01777 family protein [Porphyromonadaceae bacterium CG2_30_38_12]|nr:MAG: TIGR01777 family protein [Porphyromonadaceae bacterium CG2_30_38_12]